MGVKLNQETTARLLKKQRAWLVAVAAAYQLTPSELARKAGLSPSTLTRFLNDPKYPHALSARTIAAIEAVMADLVIPPPPPPPPAPLQPLQLDLVDLAKAPEAAE